MCNEIKKVQKTIRCAKNNKMCKKQQDVQKTIRCTKKTSWFCLNRMITPGKDIACVSTDLCIIVVLVLQPNENQ